MTTEHRPPNIYTMPTTICVVQQPTSRACLFVGLMCRITNEKVFIYVIGRCRCWQNRIADSHWMPRECWHIWYIFFGTLNAFSQQNSAWIRLNSLNKTWLFATLTSNQISMHRKCNTANVWNNNLIRGIVCRIARRLRWQIISNWWWLYVVRSRQLVIIETRAWILNT